MTRRYYLCEIIGDGLTRHTAYRPPLTDLRISWQDVASSPHDPERPGHFRPGSQFLVMADTDDAQHAEILETGSREVSPADVERMAKDIESGNRVE